MTRVLSDEAAHAAVRQIQNIINGGLTTELSNLDAQAKILSDPNHWDGDLAKRFRDDTWVTVHAALQKAKTELEDLRAELDQIQKNIFSAGGNG